MFKSDRQGSEEPKQTRKHEGMNLQGDPGALFGLKMPAEICAAA